ncbi:aldehyde dehydrogenase family protein [Rhodobacteraceae bacterium LMO-12]|nr:aldehyde dehydrogenase family protein [Rhodobacteraceae bacterium LMO-JJ12]
MTLCKGIFIDGSWRTPLEADEFDVINPATEAVCRRIQGGGAADVDAAVQAATAAATAMAALSVDDRMRILEQIAVGLEQRAEDIAQCITEEMGSPLFLSRGPHVVNGVSHFRNVMRYLKTYRFSEMRGDSLIIRQPIGVAGLISPWNWPLHLISIKVSAAIGAGCPMVLKPSEITPTVAIILAEIIAASDLPTGGFNLVIGRQAAGAAVASHPNVRMVSFTGSVVAGIRVAQAAAPSVKRVVQELGGNAANIILADVDIEAAVREGVIRATRNSGQSCNAPTRILIPKDRLEQAASVAAEQAQSLIVGDPLDPQTEIGPVASGAQFDMLRKLITKAQDDGARILCGGPDRPRAFNQGFFLAPTVVIAEPGMDIAREEVFGPIVVIQAYDDIDHAIELAEASPYGLQSFVQTGDSKLARRLVSRLTTGHVSLNYSAIDFTVPFGGMKQSGNGREGGVEGFEEYLETKAIMGAAAAGLG